MNNKKTLSNISAIIITKNAENQIVDCIESISFCDEIILIDDCSTDRTTDIAKRLGAKIINPTSSEQTDFASLRNLGLKKATNKWILYIDADERVSLDLKDSILESIKSNKSAINAYRLKRKNFYFGNHEWPYIEEFIRLFKKTSLNKWQGKLHETPIFEGEVGELNGFLLHYTHRDLSSMIEKTISWSKIEAQLRFDSNHPPVYWWRFPRVMLTGFFNSFVLQKGYKAGVVGIIESVYQAFSMFITYARLWEMQQKKSGNEKK